MQTLLLVVVILATIIAVLITWVEKNLKPEIKKWKEWLEHRRLSKLSHLCTHTSLSFREDGTTTFLTRFIWYLNLPEGAFVRCIRCRKLAYDPNLPSVIGQYWSTNPQAWREAEEEHFRQFARNNRGRL